MFYFKKKHLEEENTVNTFSHEKYEKMLDLVLKAAQEEFKQVTYDIPREQKMLIRNYQWISTVVLAAESSLFVHVVFKDRGFWPFPWELYPSSMFYLWVVLAVVMALSVFILGVDTLRGRGVTLCPTLRTYSELSQIAYEEADDNMQEKTLPGTLRTTMINDLEIAINNHRKIASSVGKKLRVMSWGLLLSLCFTGCALFPTISLNAIPAQKEVIDMSDNKTPPPPPPASVVRPPVASVTPGSGPVMVTNGATTPYVTRDHQTIPPSKK